MAIEFKFPDVGEGITEGEIVKWRVKEGDSVKEGDTLAEVETDKAVVEIPAPSAGKILKLFGKEGEKIKVGQVMAVIGGEGETATLPSAVPAPAVAKKLAVQGVGASPATRSLAKDLGVDIEKLAGTGSGGRVTDEDVHKAAEERIERIVPPAPPPIVKPAVKVALKYDFYGHLERVPIKGIRATIARHMIEARNHAVPAVGMDECDATDLWKIRAKEKKKAEKQGVHLTFLPFIIKAVVKGLQEHPFLNASIDEEANEILLKKYYNIGIAVDTPEGLMAPVIKHCDEKAVLDIARELTTLADAARARTIDLADLKGSSFSITNFGSVAGTYGVPILNYPDVAILGVGRIQDLPRVVGKKIVARKVMPLSLTFDHRAVDGAEAARFLTKIKEYIEDPDLFLLDGKA